MESELREKLRYVKIKSIKAIHTAIKKVNEFKYQINNLKKSCNYEKIKSEVINGIGQINNRASAVFKDMKYN